jgi:shikimate kinase
VINSAVTPRQTQQRQTLPPQAESHPEMPQLDRPLVLIGLMGAGKTRVGKRLATRLRLPFVDADGEIEKDTGKTIAELFATAGEPAFREGERRIMARLLGGPVCVVASGGGAYIDAETRKLIRENGLALWLRADLDTLVERTSRSNRRPLLEGVDRRAKLAELMERRYPIYAEADLAVDSLPGPVEETVDAVIAALHAYTERR